MSEALEIAKKWAQDSAFDEDFRKEIQTLLDGGKNEELEDRFYKDLEFGTGGMRGVIGAGRNRINVYTIRKATQGLANYINKSEPQGGSVAIAYDSRRKSEKFAQEASRVLAANGIKVKLYPNIHPTPLLSYAVINLKTTAGIVITASHNPPEYNGYKVYWKEGCQVTPPHDQAIIQEVRSMSDFSLIKTMDFEEALSAKLIEHIPVDLDNNYLDLIEKEAFGDIKNHADFSFIYTPLHGVGRDLVKNLMMRRGFLKLRIVPSQEFADENFSTIASPNPEEPSAFKEALEFASENDSLILATDPDADRIGVFVKRNQDWVKVNGNQIGQLLFDYKLSKLKEADKFPKNGFIVSTVVTSELIKKIAIKHGLIVYETLTGFKYIGKKIHEATLQGEEFVFACEESHGYQFQSFIREKDGVSAALFFAEMMAEYQKKNLHVLDRLEQIHQEYDHHLDALQNVRIYGPSGAAEIKNIMKSLREKPLEEIAGTKVVEVKDYLEQVVTDQRNKTKSKFEGFPQENLLAFHLENGSRISIRPSGTEPMIKYYFNLCGKDPSALQAENKVVIAEFNKLIESLRG